MNRKRVIIAAVAAVVILVVAWLFLRRPDTLTLTGIVTANEVIVSPQVAGQVDSLLVTEGDTVVANQLIAILAPGELAAEQKFYANSAQAAASQVQVSESELRFEETQADAQLRQAQATLSAAIAQAAEDSASMLNTKRVLDRYEAMAGTGGIAPQQLDSARLAYQVITSRVEASTKQVEAQEAAVALARGAQDQVAIKRSSLEGARMQHAAAAAQTQAADVRLGYTEVRAPISGFVDVRAARLGEFVNAGQPIVTLINPDSLWVRADVEETYISRIRLGDTLMVRLPSGEERPGVVFHRAVDAGFATARDVSRIKRDIRTFEIRLRVDNRDRRLAMGMTAYVLLPLSEVK
ncbi:MAG TPA: efflux RND transporter periplasmic adaptor subunit [Gemmatimonadaceae bacterium]|nr:efflux RND transporter periplasmic adaptor subunit [Gemmatimonadaceae bacterium]